MFGIISAGTIIGFTSGVVFGNLLPFPKTVWNKITAGAGVAMVACCGYLIFQAM